MPAINITIRLHFVRALNVLLGAAVLMPSSSVARAQQMAAVSATSCTMPTDATAPELMERWQKALQTRHPDRVTRLFTADGALLGFASPVARASYTAIRDYYLYFLQFEPQFKVTGQKIESGCNYLIDEGTYTWTLKAKYSGAVETREASYRFIYEFTSGQWRIAHYVEALILPVREVRFVVPPTNQTGHSLNRQVAAARVPGTAVAGYLKRHEPIAKSKAAKRAPEPVVEPWSWSDVISNR
jgi:uncharacterized protein (TIGR02246 family)